MPMLLTILVTYCLVCWLLVGVLFCLCGHELEGDGGAFTRLGQFLALVLAPLTMPFVAAAFAPCLARGIARLRQLQRFGRTYREYEFVARDAERLPLAVRVQFDNQTPALYELGFEHLGDYRLKPEPVEVHDRLFRSEDGTVLAAICALLNSGGVSFITLLEDGTIVHTTSVADPHPERTARPDDGLWISYLPGLAMWDLCRQHRDEVQRAAERLGTGVLTFRRDQFREVIIYDQRTFCRWRYRHGELDQEPPPPDLGLLLEQDPAVPART
jgi:hypothetical protein